MSVANRRLLLRISAPIALLCLLSGCAGGRCQLDPQPSSYFLRVGHLSGGDGPVSNVLQIHSGGLLVFQDTQGKVRCHRIDSVRLEQLEALVESTIYSDDLPATSLGSHDELIQVLSQRGERVFLADSLSPEVAEVLSTIDDLFEESFASSFTWKLVD